MSGPSATPDTELLEQLEHLRRESAARTAEIKLLAADVHRVLGRKAMLAALIGDSWHNAGRVSATIRATLARRSAR